MDKGGLSQQGHRSPDDLMQNSFSPKRITETFRAGKPQNIFMGRPPRAVFNESHVQQEEEIIYILQIYSLIS